MIARFYSKFDELHEQSVAQALSKNPDREKLKNDVKYRIPERWTKKFNKYDVVDINIYNKYTGTGIQDERGKVNKPGKVEKMKGLDKEIFNNILEKTKNSQSQMEQSQ